ncbi:hypothetical protein [Flavobacterium rhizosphaerae]|uniref:Lipoprotein n=1 Tax=Flavobacterium rhizosphaerae TaxID=3163298 RepID=A0ABW8YT87_9FLAO
MQLPKRYIQLIILLLTVLIATPCSIKKLYNNAIGVETSHKTQSRNAKVQCQAFVANKKEHAKKATAFAIPGFLPFFVAVAPEGCTSKKAVHFYLQQKEKVPSYLLYRSLLI